MTKLTLTEVEAIADLARLDLSDEEKIMFQDQLSAILDFVAALDALDTDDVPPTASAVPQSNVMRVDTTVPSLSVEDALANAPDQAENQFRVKPILEDRQSIL